MAVSMIRTEGHKAEITWDPQDDKLGYIAQSIDNDRLAYAIESLGATSTGLQDTDASYALSQAAATTYLARILERRGAAQVVSLRDQHGMSWRRIAIHLFDDADRQSSVRRMYESGRRNAES